MRGSGEAAARRHEDDLLSVLISRNPNGMRPENLKRHLELTDEEIHEAALRLKDRGLVRVVEHENRHQPGRVIRSYVLTDPARYPVRESVIVGDVEFPRSFHGDTVGAEDLNGFIEALAEYNARFEDRVKSIAEELTRRYWVNTAAVLALFVAVFALITEGAETVSATTGGSAWDILWRNTAALAPLAVVLLGFVFALWVFLRRL